MPASIAPSKSTGGRAQRTGSCVASRFAISAAGIAKRAECEPTTLSHASARKNALDPRRPDEALLQTGKPLAGQLKTLQHLGCDLVRVLDALVELELLPVAEQAHGAAQAVD